MNYTEAENIAQKASHIDAIITPKGSVIILVFENETEAKEGVNAISTAFKDRQLTAHFYYKSNETVDFALIAKDNADTIKIDNLQYFEGTKTYIQLTTLSEMASVNFKGMEAINFWTAYSITSGRYELNHMKEILAKGDSMLNIVGLTNEFIEVR